MKRGLLALFALTAAAILLCACSGKRQTDAPLMRFSFSHSGMHSGLIYTLTAADTGHGWQADVSLLCGECMYVLDMSEEDADRLTALVQECNLQTWAGFDKNDPRCRDGTGFSLSMDFADGTHVYAEGSNAFPKDYGAAHQAILAYFDELLEKNGIPTRI